MSDGFTREQELAASRKISEAMSLLNKLRWAGKSKAERKAVGAKLAKARKAKKEGGR